MPWLQEYLTDPFREFAAILLVAAIVGAIGSALRQPLIVSFIAVGILVGPAGLGLVEHAEQVELLASMGIAVLLFLVGLRLDVGLVRTMGPVALATGLGQVAFTSIIGFGICLLLGMNTVTSLYVAVALTFSSTIIIVKLLSDKREIDALHGRIAVGFLIVQDIVVVLALIVLSAFSGATGEGEAERGIAWHAMMILLRGIALLAGIAAMMRWVLPRLTHAMAKHQELLVLFAIAWAVSLAALGDMLGFSKEMGAFLAGVSLAPAPFRDAIAGRLVSVRDFLLLFFFVHLGANLDLRQIRGDLLPGVILSAFVLVGNPLIVMVIMGAMGYRKRTGFLAGLTVAQISEFSLIFGALGVALGHIAPETMGLVTLVGLITIGLSTYMIIYSHPMYERLSPILSIFERTTPHREQSDGTVRDVRTDAIVFGLGRFGANIGRRLRDRGMRVLGVDFDPQAVRQWCEHGGDAQYGDAEDPEFAASLPLAQADWVVCSVPQLAISRIVMHTLRERGFAGRIALTAHNHADARTLKELGADLVLLPFVDAAERAVEKIIEGIGDEARDQASGES